MWPTPPFSPQSSPTTGSDAYDCSNEGFIGCVEMIQGNFQQFSVRANAVMTGTSLKAGNSIQNVVDKTNQNGLISYTTWPDLAVFNERQYYQTPPPEVIKMANHSMRFSLVAPDIRVSPVILRVKYPNTYHFMITPDGKNAIDSYAPQVKPINWSIVVGQWSLKIKINDMVLGYKVDGVDTVYVQVGNAFVPLTDWQAFLNLGGSAESVVTISQDQLNKSSVIASDYFKSK